MEKEALGFVGVLLMVLSFSIMFYLGFIAKSNSGISSKERIVPEMLISGLDTTFIYKEYGR